MDDSLNNCQILVKNEQPGQGVRMFGFGLGLTIKQLNKTRATKRNPKVTLGIDFLSKFGAFFGDGVVYNRRIQRVLESGNFTTSNLTVAQHNFCITASLESIGFSYPVIKSLIEHRKENIQHDAVYVGNRTHYAVHKHQFDYQNYRPEILSLYDIGIVGIMEDNVVRAPLYVASLYRAVQEEPQVRVTSVLTRDLVQVETPTVQIRVIMDAE